MKSAPSLRLVLQRSRLAFRGLIAIHLLALPMPWLAALAWWAKLVVTVGLVASLAWHWRQERRPRPTGLRLLPDGAWAVMQADEEWEMQLAGAFYCTPWLTVLPLMGRDGSKRRLLLWPDSAPSNDLRHLRIWLRWGVVAK